MTDKTVPGLNPAVVLSLCAVLLIGCQDTSKKTDVAAEPSVRTGYGEEVEPGRMLCFPPVPVMPAVAENILHNPGFEDGESSWAAAEGPSKPVRTASFFAEGRGSLQIEPAATGDAFVFQIPLLAPRTFYRFQALVLSLGAGEVTLEVRDKAGNALVSGDSIKGPIEAWTPVSLVFVTGMEIGEARVGFRVSGNSPVYVDQCALSPLPTTSLFEGGTMETPPSEDKMAVWYFKSGQLNPVTPGHNSEHSLELPMCAGTDSSIAGLIDVEKLSGSRVWISAMIKSVGEGSDKGPEVTMEWRFMGADSNPSVSTVCYPTGDWTEAGFIATIPPNDESQPGTAQPLFGTLLFRRPAGVAGQVFVDDVAVFLIGEPDFKGGALV